MLAMRACDGWRCPWAGRQRAVALTGFVAVLALAGCGEVGGEADDDRERARVSAEDDEHATTEPPDETGDSDEAPEGSVDHRGQQASDDDFEAAAARAEADGQVRVIVGLQVAFTPEGAQSAADNAAQREAIRREQDRIVAKLEGTDFMVEHRFDSVPQIVLTLSPEAVDALWRSERAASIQLDEAVPPA